MCLQLEFLLQIRVSQYGYHNKFLYQFMEQFNYSLHQVKFHSLDFTFLTIFYQIKKTGSNATKFIDELFVDICNNQKKLYILKFFKSGHIATNSSLIKSITTPRQLTMESKHLILFKLNTHLDSFIYKLYLCSFFRTLQTCLM